MYTLLGRNLELRCIVSIDRGREYATCLKFGALAKAQLDEHHVQQERWWAVHAVRASPTMLDYRDRDKDLWKHYSHRPILTRTRWLKSLCHGPSVYLFGCLPLPSSHMNGSGIGTSDSSPNDMDRRSFLSYATSRISGWSIISRSPLIRELLWRRAGSWWSHRLQTSTIQLSNLRRYLTGIPTPSNAQGCWCTQIARLRYLFLQLLAQLRKCLPLIAQ